MNWNTLQHSIRVILPASCALALLCGGTTLASETWIDDVWNMVAFEKANYPTSDFAPYFQKLDRIKTGLNRGDQQLAKMETDRFLKMLMDRRHGIAVAPAADRGHPTWILMRRYFTYMPPYISANLPPYGRHMTSRGSVFPRNTFELTRLCVACLTPANSVRCLK